MALWTYRLDTLELNDHESFVMVIVPQIDDLPPGTNIMVEMAGDWPEFVRWQPEVGVLTVNMVAVRRDPGGAVQNCSTTEWPDRIATLQSALTPGLHTFYAQARGWPGLRQVSVAPRSMATNFKLRQISVEFDVPKPVWTPV